MERQPVVLRSRAQVALKYRDDCVLHPTDRRAHDRGVWSAEGGALHLYYGPDQRWRLSTKYEPGKNHSRARTTAYIDSLSMTPPCGEATWRLGRDFRGASGEDEPWADGALTLLSGDGAAVAGVR